MVIYNADNPREKVIRDVHHTFRQIVWNKAKQNMYIRVSIGN